MKPSVAVAVLGFLFFGSGEEKPELTDFRVAVQGRRVEVSVDLLNAFSDELLERIQTGLASGFTYQFVLYRDQKRWWDNRIDSSELDVVAMYNAVTREYLVNYKQDGKLIDSRIARTREELGRLMTHIEGLTMFQLGGLNPQKRYLLRARVILGSKTTMLIVPSRISTDWLRSRKFRPPADQP